MKHVKLAAIAVGMMIAMISCKKDTQEMPPAVTPVTPANQPTAVGFWHGKYGNGATLGIYYAQLLRSDGTMRAYIGGTDTASATHKSEGTWSVNGLVVKTTYKVNASNTHTTEGMANKDFTSIEGAWKSSLAIGAGGYKMTKQK